MFFLLLTKYSFVLTFTPVTGVARAGFAATHHHRLYASTAQEDFSNDIGYWKGQVEGLKMAVEGFKTAAQIAETALARSDKAVEIAESSRKDTIQAAETSRKDTRKDLQDLISILKIQLLQAKGTMTCRGLLEEATRDVIYENGLNSRMPISDALSKLDVAYPKWQQDPKKVGRRTAALLSAWRDCVKRELSDSPGMYYRELYQELSKEMHGAGWSGPSVKFTFAKDQKDYLCIFKAICDSYDLKLELDDEQIGLISLSWIHCPVLLKP